MKTIFDEKTQIGSFEIAWSQTYSSRADVSRHTSYVYATTTAHYDVGTRVLVIDQKAYENNEYERYDPRSQRVFETQPSCEAALRSVISLADDWYEQIRESIPTGDASLTDAEVIERTKVRAAVAEDVSL